MTTPREPRQPDDLPDLESWDETLFEAGQEVADDFGLPDDPALREAVLEQRFAHGLLVQHFESDAVAERRVRRIIEGLPRPVSGGVVSGGVVPGGVVSGGAVSGGAEAGETNVIPFWRRFAPAVAAALLVSATAAWLAGWFDDRDEIKALIAAARDHADDLVDRHYDLWVYRILDDGREEQTGKHEFYVRPGGIFRVELDGMAAGRKTIGCDGREAWRQIYEDGKKIQEQRTVDKVRELFRQGLHPEGFFDIGYLDVDRVLSKVPEAIDLFEYEVGAKDGSGEMLAHVFGRASMDLGLTDLRSLDVWARPETGMVDQLTFELVDEATGHVFRFDFRYAGEVKKDLAFYSRP